jgi:hypothetical protein
MESELQEEQQKRFKSSGKFYGQWKCDHSLCGHRKFSNSEGSGSAEMYEL